MHNPYGEMFDGRLMIYKIFLRVLFSVSAFGLMLGVSSTSYAACPQDLLQQLISNKYSAHDIKEICNSYKQSDECCCQFVTLEKKSKTLSTRKNRERKVKREFSSSEDGLKQSQTTTWSKTQNPESLYTDNWRELETEFKWLHINKCGGTTKPENSMKKLKTVSRCIDSQACGK